MTGRTAQNFVPRLASFTAFLFCMASAALGQAETASPTLVAETPRVPAVGIEIPEDTRLALRERTDALGQAIDQLRDQFTETPP
ncbi:MAG: hypothetical protein ACPHJZ_05755, partial [Limisphaerales bacterium]